MPSVHKVQTEPVQENRERVIEVLLEYLGPGSDAQAERLVEEGGTVVEGLNREAAEQVKAQLREAGAEAHIIAEETDEELPSMLRGRVRGIEGRRPVEGAEVTIRPATPDVDELIGSATTGVDGIFTMDRFGINVEEFFPDSRPELQVTVVRDGQEVETRHKDFDWEAFAREGYMFEIEAAAPLPSDEGGVFTVSGHVVRSTDEPAEGVTVRASDRDLRSQQLLGEATTDECGEYKITYTADQFSSAEKGRADLVLQVFNEMGTELEVDSSQEDTIFNAEREEVVDLQIISDEMIKPSEYERLIRALTPLLEGVPLADLTEDDITFLAMNTGQEANIIRFVSLDAQLSQEYNLPEAVFYGFARRDVGVVDDETGPRIDLAALLEQKNDTLRDHLDAAISNQIIPVQLRESLDDIIARLDALRTEQQERQREEWPRHEPTGRLLNEETEDPLVGYTVRATDQDAQPEPRDLGHDYTDEEGDFSFSYPIPPGQSDISRAIQLTVLSPDGEEIAKREQTVQPGQSADITLRITVPEAPVPGADEDIRSLSIGLPEDAVTELENKGVKTLPEIRSFDNLMEIDGIGEERADELLAHANLSILSLDEEVRSSLIENGFRSPIDIANTPREDFTRTINGEPSNPDRLYDASVAAKNTVDNLITDYRTNRASGILPDGQVIPDEFELPPEIPDPCNCRDCESAVSPAAYLVDLIQYVLDHVTEEGDEIKLDRLEGLFHQPFGDLPVSCETSEEEVRQIRICIEVLLRHLGESQIQFLSNTTSKGAEYRSRAYDSLLTQFGTSREELRLAQATGDEEQRSLASRLGIAVDHLDRLLFDPSASLSSTSGALPLSEENLEEVFGLPAFTYYDSYNSTLTLPDPLRDLSDPLLLQWQIEHQRHQWTTQDHPIDDYMSEQLPLIDPDVVTPDDFRTPDAINSTAFEIWVNRRQWVDDRLKELEKKTKSVTLDGDTIDVPDIHAMINDVMTNTITYEDVQQVERNETPWIRTLTLEQFRTKLQKLNEGTDAEKVRKTIKEEFHLSVESFSRLVEIWEKDEKWTADKRHPRVTESEWSEVRSILVQAQKRSFYGWWIWQEQNLNVVLGPKEFWLSLREPTQGPWSSTLEEAHDQTNPFIDPEQIDLDELPGPTASKQAIVLWKGRQRTLERKRDSLWKTYRQNGFDAVLNDEIYTQGPPGGHANWDEYFENREIEDIDDDLSLEDEESARKLKSVRAEAKVGSTSSNGSTPPSSAELEDIISMLTSAWKRKEKYSDWFTTEKTEDLATYWKVRKAQLPKWRASQEDRQQWQQALQQRSRPPIIDPDLLIPGEDFEDPVPGNAPFDLWQDRQKTLSQNLQNLRNTMPHQALVNDIKQEVNSINDLRNFPEKLAERLSPYPVDEILDNPDDHSPSDLGDYLSEDITRFHRLIDDAIGVSLKTLIDLAKKEEHGSTIDGRLAQLTLTRSAFYFLVDVHERLVQGTSLPANTWEEVYHLLVAIIKKRQYAEWQLEERPTYFFDLDPKFSDELNADNISSSLRTEFQNQGAGLSQNVTTTTQESGNRWRLHDEGNDRIYTVVTGRVKFHQAVPEETLHVYLYKGSISGTIPHGAVILSPGFFRLADRKEVFDRFDDESPEHWRMNRESMREWRDTLEARIQRRNQLGSALEEAVDQTETETLAFLRDALVEQLENPSESAPFGEKAEWASERLMIDTQVGTCSKTTRVSQAMESLQTLLFALDSGQDVRGAADSLTVDDSNFDQRWKWIGTYRRWKAAMGARLYSENLLRPRLRRWQTPKFKEIMSRVREQNPSPSGLRTEVGKYRRYLQDINTLELQAACWADVDSNLSSGNSYPELPKDERLVFLFAKGGTPDSGYRLYWSAYNPEEQDPTKAQTFWQEIPKTRVESTLGRDDAGDIVGAVPYLSEHGKYICTFINRQKDGDPELVLSRFDLTVALWEQQEPTTLGLPDVITDEGRLEAVPIQPTERQSLTEPPRFVISDSGKHLYLRQLNENGTGWAEPPDPDPMYDWRRDEVRIKEINGKTLSSDQSFRFPRFFDGDYNDAKKSLNNEEIDNKLFEAFEQMGWPLADSESDLNITKFDDSWDIWDSENSIGYDIKDTGELLKVSPDPHNNVPKWGDKIFDKSSGIFRPLAAFYISRPGSNRVDINFIFSDLQNAWSSRLIVIPSDQELTVDLREQEPLGAGQSIRPQNFLGAHKFSGEPTIFWDENDIYRQDLGDRNNKQREDITLRSVPRICGSPESDIASCPCVPYQASTNRVEIYSTTYSESTGLNVSFADRVPLALRGIDFFELTDKALESHTESGRSFLEALQYSIQMMDFSDHVTMRVNLTYLDEAYYFLPLSIALHLQSEQNYSEALEWYRLVYEYEEQTGAFPFELLSKDGTTQSTSMMSDVVFDGGLNPHSIAEAHVNTKIKYKQFTLLSLIQCLLDYADEEFTQDTTASVQRARLLYETGLDLLETEELKQLRHPCEELEVNIKKRVNVGVENGRRDRIGLDPWVKRQIESINEVEKLRKLEEQLNKLDINGESRSDRIKKVNDAVAEVTEEEDQPKSLQASLQIHRTAEKNAFQNLLTNDEVARVSSQRADQMLSLPNTLHTTSSVSVVRTVSLAFCFPANPVLKSLRQHANLNLQKIRSCRNFAGMKRKLELYTAPTGAESAAPRLGGTDTVGGTRQISLNPTDYRYDTLIERTKELVNLAQDIESSFLSAIESRDAESYKLLQARQDIELTRAGVQLQHLRVNKAEERVDLSELQKERASLRVERYNKWVSGLQEFEETDIYKYQKTARDLTMASAVVSGVAGVAGAIAGGIAGGASGPQGSAGGSAAGATLGALSNLGGTSQALQGIASWYRTKSNIAQLRASRRRMRRRWELQRDLAKKDTRIASERVDIAESQVDIAEQEREISEIKADHAEDTVEFLQDDQFTNVELFDWMADVLEGVYRYFLQQATSMAKLAEKQLAFERQELPQQFIQPGYWRAPREGQTNVSRDEESQDRRGLTGSARLLQDIYQLDQYAFRTDERKQQVSKTISLAQLAPFELQQFRETGVLSFDTYRELFEREHPDHYMRLIKNVSVSVIALIPPTDGIKAKLSNSGISRVVTGGPSFQTEVIRRDPESITLSSPQNDTGVFQLKPEGEKLNPFEKTGVDTSWELRMPKAANAFDYDTIADVLLTINYTALESSTYRQQVIERLDPEQSGQRTFRFSEEFADPWYDLHNPSQTDDPMTVRFETRRADFPQNMTDVEIENVMLYYVTAEGVDTEDLKTTLEYIPEDGQEAVGGTSTPVEQRISTRRGNGSSWMSMIGKSVEGEWELSLPDTAKVKRMFNKEEIEDILFVVTYEGRTPDWPA